LFNSKFAKKIENEAKKSNIKFIGTLTKLPKINVENAVSKLNINEKLKKNIKIKLKSYLSKMNQ